MCSFEGISGLSGGQWLCILAPVLFCLVAWGIGLRFLGRLLERKQQGLGPNNLKALGLVLVVPVVAAFGLGAALGAPVKAEVALPMLGTLVGYLFGQRDRSESAEGGGQQDLNKQVTAGGEKEPATHPSSQP